LLYHPREWAQGAQTGDTYLRSLLFLIRFLTPAWLWHDVSVPDESHCERLRREAAELLETAAKLVEHAATLKAQAAELRKQLAQLERSA